MTWDQFNYLLEKAHFDRQQIYLQRQLLATIANYLRPKQSPSKSAKQYWPLPGEKEEVNYDEIRRLMDEDPAFQPDTVMIPGKGYFKRSELNGNGSGT